MVNKSLSLLMCVCLICSNSEAGNVNTKIYPNYQDLLKNNNAAIKITKIKSLGNIGDKYENELYGMKDIKIDYSGNVYVLYRQACQIKKYDKDGNTLLSIGRKGQGPGELINPTTLYVTENQEIYVYDIGKREILYFNKAGKYISSIKPIQVADDFIVKANKDIAILASFANNRIVTYNSKGKMTGSFGEIVAGKNPMETMYLNTGVLTNDLDNLYHASNQPYVIDKYSNEGKILLNIKRDVPYKIIAPEYKQYKNKDNLEVVAMMTNETKIPQDICVDGNRIYYLTKEYGNKLSFGKSIDVFDKNGKYLTTIELEYPIARAISVSNGKLAVVYESLGASLPKRISSKQMETPFVAVYRIEGK